MQIAQECLKDETSNRKSRGNNEMDATDAFDSSGLSGLIGLEGFARTIDSVLARIEISAEHISIRIEHLLERNYNGYSNGIALEFKIKSIKYFDSDSNVHQSNQMPSGTTSNKDENLNRPSIAIKNFQIEGNCHTQKSINVCRVEDFSKKKIFHPDDGQPRNGIILTL
jgi:hypothetical protein